MPATAMEQATPHTKPAFALRGVAGPDATVARLRDTKTTIAPRTSPAATMATALIQSVDPFMLSFLSGRVFAVARARRVRRRSARRTEAPTRVHSRRGTLV